MEIKNYPASTPSNVPAPIYETIQEIAFSARTGTLDVNYLTPIQKVEFDLYAAQGGFRGTGLPSQ